MPDNETQQREVDSIHISVRELIDMISSMPNSMTNKQEHIAREKIFDDIEKILSLMRCGWRERAEKSTFSGFAESYVDIIKTLQKELKQKSKLIAKESNGNRNKSLITFLEQCAINIDRVMKSEDGALH